MKGKGKLTLDKEIITSLSMNEMDSLLGGKVLNEKEIPDTNYVGCFSFGCVEDTGCQYPPEKDTLQCTGNGCISGRYSCLCTGFRCEELTQEANCGTVFSIDICEPLNSWKGETCSD